MPKLKYYILSIFVFSLLLGACKSSEQATDSAAAEPEPMSMEDELIAKNIEARGGLENIQAINTLFTMGSAQLPSMGMEMPIKVFAKRPKKVRVEVVIESMGAEIVQAYDGEKAWTINPMAGPGAQEMPMEQARTVIDQADMDGRLINHEEKGYAITYVGEEEVRGKNAHKLQVSKEGEPDLFVFLDAETFLEVKTQTEGVNPMSGAAATVESYTSNFREVNGVMMPYKIEVVIGGQTFQEVTMEGIEVNNEMDETLFAFPEG